MARPVKVTAKSKKEKSGPSQLERFVAIARDLETDESGATFEQAFGKLVPKKPRPKAAPKSRRIPGRQT